MQGIVLLGVFLKVTPFAKHNKMSKDMLLKGVEKSIRKYFGAKSEKVVEDNMKCVQRGYTEVIEVK